MYEARFSAVSGSDWAQAVELRDANTGLVLDTDDAAFELAVRDRSNSIVLKASTADATMEIPATGQVRWRFTKEQMAALCPGTTYGVGLRMLQDQGTTSLIVGSLAYLDGEFA